MKQSTQKWLWVAIAFGIGVFLTRLEVRFPEDRALFEDLAPYVVPEWTIAREIYTKLGEAKSTFGASKQKTALSASEEAKVKQVFDGDTFLVILHGQEKKVRIIGINTPETGGPYRTRECFGQEAKKELQKILPQGSIVRLEPDASQHNQDTYGRLLRAVYVDQINVGEHMIRQGFAHEYTYQVPYQYQALFREAEHEAKENQRGLWGKNACGEQASERG
jgi:micrococcal nuclease